MKTYDNVTFYFSTHLPGEDPMVVGSVRIHHPAGTVMELIVPCNTDRHGNLVRNGDDPYRIVGKSFLAQDETLNKLVQPEWLGSHVGKADDDPVNVHWAQVGASGDTTMFAGSWTEFGHPPYYFMFALEYAPVF
jgi:hypothetical protein